MVSSAAPTSPSTIQSRLHLLQSGSGLADGPYRGPLPAVPGPNSGIDSADFRGLHFGDGGVEAQYYFTNPSTDPLGISIIVSARFSERGGFSTEDFLVLQKDFGSKWIVAYNLGFVTEVENFYSGGDQ